MAKSKDATELIRKKAASFPDVQTGTSCNQSSFKVGKVSFLFIGPGAKGVGYKAMFKLDRSMKQAVELAKSDPDHFQVGSTGWVTARFANDTPLPKRIWEKWLKESYEICCGTTKATPKKSTPKKSVKKASTKKAGTKKSVRKKSKPKPRSSGK